MSVHARGQSTEEEKQAGSIRGWDMTVIHAENLSKQFRTKVKPEGLGASFSSLFKPDYRFVDAVKDVSFSVDKGEILAFLGPNGAGKSSTIKMLTGILYPSSGKARVLGHDPVRDRKELAYRVGSVFGQRSQLWAHLPATDSFRLLGAIFDIPGPETRRRAAELAERFQLGDFLDVPVRKLSLGQRIRCEIAASLLHQPELLFLDEPTIGLDVVVKQEIRTLLTELNRDAGVTIFLTSHDIGDIEKICKRAIVINHGTIVVDESVKSLKHLANRKKIVGVKFATRVPGKNAAFADEEGIHILKSTPDAMKLDVDTRIHSLTEIVARLGTLGEVSDLNVEDEPLENLIADLYSALSKEDAHERTQAFRA